MEIDLNADLGEGAGTDAAIVPLITSANICCGAHAGDDETIRNTLSLAKSLGVSVGAHPGYPDRVNFGRENIVEPTDELVQELTRQVNHFQQIAKELDVPVRYIKPHGALYNQAASDERFARIVCELANAARLPIVGLPESKVESASLMAGTPFYSEGFADRRYNPDGTLVPRSEANAVLTDVREVVEQVQWLVNAVRVRTICVHGDTPGAVAFIAAVRDEMLKTGFTLKAFA
jgi:5-oxoprolinase (ATP-hydrolysing) subunit A